MVSVFRVVQYDKLTYIVYFYCTLDLHKLRSQDGITKLNPVERYIKYHSIRMFPAEFRQIV